MEIEFSESPQGRVSAVTPTQLCVTLFVLLLDIIIRYYYISLELGIIRVTTLRKEYSKSVTERKYS